MFWFSYLCDFSLTVEMTWGQSLRQSPILGTTRSRTRWVFNFVILIIFHK